MSKKNLNLTSFEKEIKQIRNKLKMLIDEMDDAQVLALLAFIISAPDEELDDFDDIDMDEELPF